MKSKHKQAILANQTLKKVLEVLGIKVEARSTSASGAWLTIIGTQAHRSLPSWVVANIRIVDNFVDFHRWAVADSELDYETAKRQCYEEARAFYEDISSKLKSPSATIEDEPTDRMEVLNPDGTKEWIN